MRFPLVAHLRPARARQWVTLLVSVLAVTAAPVHAQVRAVAAPMQLPPRVKAVPIRNYTPSDFRARFRALPNSAQLLSQINASIAGPGTSATLTALPTSASASGGLSAVGGTVTLSMAHMTVSQGGWDESVRLSGSLSVDPTTDGGPPVVSLQPGSQMMVELAHPTNVSDPVIYVVMLDVAGGHVGSVLAASYGACSAAAMAQSAANGVATCAVTVSDHHPEFGFPITYDGTGGSAVQLVDVTIMRVR